eukprot:COSAG02_NODE_43010_length_379_cov_0.639286_1_plen_62_part_10
MMADGAGTSRGCSVSLQSLEPEPELANLEPATPEKDTEPPPIDDAGAMVRTGSARSNRSSNR